MIGRAKIDMFSDSIGLFFFDKLPNGAVDLVQNFEVRRIEEHECVRQDVAPLHIDRAGAQVLMDDLWNCGIRPTDGAGTAGSMRATEKHLEDMRAIVFQKMEIQKP